MSVYFGEIHDGAVILPADCPLREGQRVRVEPVEEQPEGESPADPPPALDADHPAFGTWADRPEMADSVAYSRTVRERLARRDPDG